MNPTISYGSSYPVISFGGLSKSEYMLTFLDAKVCSLQKQIKPEIKYTFDKDKRISSLIFSTYDVLNMEYVVCKTLITYIIPKIIYESSTSSAVIYVNEKNKCILKRAGLPSKLNNISEDMRAVGFGEKEKYVIIDWNAQCLLAYYLSKKYDIWKYL